MLISTIVDFLSLSTGKFFLSENFYLATNTKKVGDFTAQN